MLRSRLAAALGLLLLPALPAQAPRVRYLDVGFMESSLPDLKYGGNTNPWTQRWEELRLDLYLPAGDTAPARPVYVHVHGGEFFYGSKRNGEALMFCKDLTYRLAPTADHRGWGPTVAAEDAKAAVRWVRANAQRYRLDPTRIVLGGDSAGAGTAILAAYTAWAGSSGNPGHRHVPDAVFNMWGWHAAPVQDPACSLYSVHGMLDHATSYLVAVGIHQEAERHGLFHQLQLLPQGGHSPFHLWPDFRDPWLSFLFEAFYLHELAGLGAVDGHGAGRPLTIHASGWQNDVAHLFAGVANRAPITIPGLGDLWLDPARALALGQLRFGELRTATRSLTFQVPPELRGATIDWQALYLPKAGRFALLSNLLTTSF